MKSISIPKCGIYKYVYHGEIIYIGKSDSSISDRIIAHETEEKFQKYLKEAEIYYFECKNPAETTIYETALINRYCPVLNVSMNYRETQEFLFPFPTLHIIYENKIKKRRRKNENQLFKKRFNVFI